MFFIKLGKNRWCEASENKSIKKKNPYVWILLYVLEIDSNLSGKKPDPLKKMIVAFCCIAWVPKGLQLLWGDSRIKSGIKFNPESVLRVSDNSFIIMWYFVLEPDPKVQHNLYWHNFGDTWTVLQLVVLYGNHSRDNHGLLHTKKNVRMWNWWCCFTAVPCRAWGDPSCHPVPGKQEVLSCCLFPPGSQTMMYITPVSIPGDSTAPCSHPGSAGDEGPSKSCLRNSLWWPFSLGKGNCQHRIRKLSKGSCQEWENNLETLKMAQGTAALQESCGNTPRMEAFCSWRLNLALFLLVKQIPWQGWLSLPHSIAVWPLGPEKVCAAFLSQG